MKRYKEFKVNDYITLKLEHGITNIYVKGYLFQQCKYLLLQIPIGKIRSFDDIESIDDAAERLDNSMEGLPIEGRQRLNIDPETEFWGHCSNLQAWAEQGYDTRLLHSNLSFPLLRKLASVGDPKAKRAFKEEIARRFLSGSMNVIRFLLKEGYFSHFSNEELEVLFQDLYDAKDFPNKPLIALTILNELSRAENLKIMRTFKEELINSFQYEDENLIELIIKEKILHYFSQEEIDRLLKRFNSLKIAELNLKDSSVKILPDWMSNLRTLKVLNLQNNPFKYIPDLIFRLVTLEELNLSRNKISYLPRTISELTSLRKLDLMGNNLRTFPEVLLDLPRLQELDLGFNRLKGMNAFPEKLLYQTTLDYFRDSSSKKRQYPKVYPKSLEMLSNLRVLSLRGNDITFYPKFIKNFKGLMKLDLGGNNLWKIPKSIGTLKSLRALELDRNNLRFIPKKIGNLTDLRILRLGDNRISFLPNSVGNLRDLRELSLERNRMLFFQKELGRLKSLQTLNLIMNHLGTFPEAIIFLRALRELYLDGTYLDALPSSIGMLRELKALTLNSNYLETLPEPIGNLKSLEALTLDSNKLKSLPKSIGKMNSLESLDLTDNQITTLPEEILNLRSLREIRIRDNPLDSRSVTLLEELKKNGVSVDYEEI